MLNSGNAIFAAPVSYYPAVGGSTLVLMDVNRDDVLDVVTRRRRRSMPRTSSSSATC
jgi:hypothetical protein